VKSKITHRDVLAVANLFSKRMQERESLLILGIDYGSWIKWKSKKTNCEKFAAAFIRAKAKTLGLIFGRFPKSK
jgi:hypothetical protein